MRDIVRVLYAEDDLPDTDLTKTYFEVNAPDFELDVVPTGRQCLSMLRQGRHDVLLLDNHLPDMDGIDVLKELAAADASIPVVMVTGVGDEDLVVQVLRLGAVDYVSKQAKYLESLPAVLRRAVADHQKPGEQRRHAGTRGQRSILYVEHDPADIDLTLTQLATTARHLRLEVVRSSSEALKRLREDRFDLVLADLRLPDINALDLLREAKHRGLLVPFIIITGKGDEGGAVAALKLGAYDYIVKRDNYLTQLPYAIENAVDRWQLVEINRRLQTELAERARAEAENARLLLEVTGQRRRLDEIMASVPGLVWETWGHPDAADQRTAFISDHVERISATASSDGCRHPISG